MQATSRLGAVLVGQSRVRARWPALDSHGVGVLHLGLVFAELEAQLGRQDLEHIAIRVLVYRAPVSVARAGVHPRELGAPANDLQRTAVSRQHWVQRLND